MDPEEFRPRARPHSDLPRRTPTYRTSDPPAPVIIEGRDDEGRRHTDSSDNYIPIRHRARSGPGATRSYESEGRRHTDSTDDYYRSRSGPGVLRGYEYRTAPGTISSV